MPDFHTGSVFAGHRIEGIAGKGGMGIVYRATQLALDRTVALKLIAPELADDPAFRERFVAESKAAASIEHPNVFPIYYAEERDGILYIAMRFVDGDDLRKRLRSHGALSPRRAARIVDQVASALDAAHERGLVHRDVKPANVLIPASHPHRPRDHAYLTDFGLTKAVAASSAASRTKGWVGTLGYVAPEQIRGERVDARADVYALACVLFHALAGRPPYGRDSDEVSVGERPNDVAVASGTAWVSSSRSPTVVRIDTATGRVRRPSLRAGRGVKALAAGYGSLWVLNFERGTISRYSLRTRRLRSRSSVPSGRPAGVAIGSRAVWVSTIRSGAAAGELDAVLRLDPDSGRIVRRVPVAAGVGGLDVGLGAVWLVNRLSQSVTRLDVRTGALTSVAVGPDARGISVGEDAVWVGSFADDAVTRIDPRTLRRTTVATGSGPTSIDAADGAVWVVNNTDSTLTRIDPETRRRVGEPVPVALNPFAIAVARGSLWVTSLGEDKAERVDF